MKMLQLVAILTLVSFSTQLLTGCTSMRPISIDVPPQRLVERIHQGDSLIIHYKNGGKYSITVDSINTIEIIGNDLVFKLNDIEKLYTEQVDGLKIAGCLVGGYFSLIAIGAIGVAIGVAMAL